MVDPLQVRDLDVMNSHRELSIGLVIPPSHAATTQSQGVIKLIENDGWYHVRTKGSHRQYKHSSKPGIVTVAGHPKKVLHPKTLGTIIRQAQLKKQ